MGLAYDPDKTFRYVLLNERQKPEGEQSKYLFRYLSARDYAKVEGLFVSAIGLENIAYVAKVVEGLRLCMVGWENVRDGEVMVAFDPAEIDAHLSVADLSEMRQEVLHEMHLSELEKKRSAFAALSTSGNSAKPTDTVAA